MRSAADEMRRVAARLHDNLRVDVGLDEAIEADDPGTPASLAAAQAAVLARIRAMQTASGELRQLLRTLTDLGALARFTTEGWPERRRELAAAFAADAMAGLAEWAGECCLAAAELRTEALERLAAEQFGYPAGAFMLQRRFHTAQRALAKRDWRRARPVLRAAAEGLCIAGTEVPAPEVRAALRILLARIAVHLDEDPSADLEAAERLGAPTADTALVRAWAARIADRPGEAAAYLADARAGGSSIAVIAELARQTPQADDDASLSAARDRLASVASIVDISSQLDRLIEPAPAQVWLAAAERAIKEADRALAVTALDRAEQQVADRYVLGAIICERRAQLLAADGDADGDKAAVVDAWLTAGDYRWSAGQPDVAQRHYGTVLTLQPDNMRAALGQLCAEASEWSAKPGRESNARLAEVLAKLESLQAERGVGPAPSWSLRNLAGIHAEQAKVGEDTRASHMWKAFLALGRALIFNPNVAGAWGQLADVMGTFGLYQAAVIAARRAFALDRGMREELIRATLNVGDLDAGRDLLSEGTDHDRPWVKAVDAFIQLRTGNLENAIGLLRDATSADPGLAWARDHLMRAYLVSGETELARREARQLSAYIGDRRDPENLENLADCALVSGNLAQAEQLGAELAEWERRNVDAARGMSAMGSAKLLAGQAEGVADLVQVVMKARTVRQLDDWERIDLPILHALASERRIELADLGPVTEAVARRRIELGTEADPLIELSDAAASLALPVAHQARAVLAVLLREAGGDAAGALADLEAGAPAAAGVPEWPRLADRVRRNFVADCLGRDELDKALAAEQARLADPAHAEPAGRLAEIAGLFSLAGRHDDAARALLAARERAGASPELTRTEGDLLWRSGQRAQAAKTWESARAEGAGRIDVRLGVYTAGTDASQAAGLLREAIAHSYIDAAADLHALLTEPADIAAVTAALREAGSDADTWPGAMVAIEALEALPGELRLPEHGLGVHLPPSWFAGAADPVNDVPLLARYIPEARLRLPWTLPGVQAADDANLEPDGYRIFVLGQLAEQGQLPPQVDYVVSDTVPLLSPAAQARVTEQRAGDIIAVRRPGEGDLAGLDALLLVPAAEVIALRIEAVATVFSSALKQYWSHVSKS
jgi:tetratricopeptide (TPR) repeat protein